MYLLLTTPENGPLVSTPVTTLVAGDIYALTCYVIGTAPPANPVFVQIFIYNPQQPPPAAPVTTVPGLVASARSALVLAHPQLRTQPPADRLVVGFETWVANSVAPPIDTRSAQAGGFWATAQARPVAISIDYGDHTAAQRCSLPLTTGADGRPDCARHTYLDHRLAPNRDGAFTVAATFTFEIWVSTNEQPLPFLADTIDGPPISLPVAVHEVQAVLR